MNKFLEKILGPPKEKQPKLSKGVYCYPLNHPNPASIPTDNDPVQNTHTGPYKGAIDFLVPPGTEVVAADDGIVIEIRDGSTEYGDNPTFSDKANLVTIWHPRTNERSQYIHLEANIPLILHNHVSKGEPIGRTGLSGYMDGPHLHFLVFEPATNEHGFVGLTPNFKQ